MCIHVYSTISMCICVMGIVGPNLCWTELIWCCLESWCLGTVWFLCCWHPLTLWLMLHSLNLFATFCIFCSWPDDDSTMTRIHSTQLSGCGASGAGQRSRWLRNRHKGAAPWRKSENCENPRNWETLTFKLQSLTEYSHMWTCFW